MRERLGCESDLVLLVYRPETSTYGSPLVEARSVIPGPEIIYGISYSAYGAPTTTMIYPNEELTWKIVPFWRWEQFILTENIVNFLIKDLT